MGTQPIEWHKECLKNLTISVQQRRNKVAQRMAELEDLEHRLMFYSQQIETAEKRGMEAFDAERLLVKRGA